MITRKDRDFVRVSKVSHFPSKCGYEQSRKVPIPHHKTVAIILLLMWLCLAPVLVFSALMSTVSFSMTGQIFIPPLVNTFIGQYVNGTYYAKNLDTGLTWGTDSYSASRLINDAITIANANTGGGRVQIGGGSYFLSETIVPKSNVYLQVASDATLYQTQLSSLAQSISLVLSTSAIDHFTLDGGIWDGKKGSLSDHRDTSTWSSYYFDYFGIAVYSDAQSNNIVIKNVILKNVIGQGIDLRTCKNSLISNCTVNNAGDNPITFEGYSGFNSNSIVEYCTVIGGQDVGINNWLCGNITIRHNTVNNVDDHVDGSHWGIGAEGPTCSIIGNTVTGSGMGIILAWAADNCLVENNTVIGPATASYGHGIQVQTNQGAIVRGNTISNWDYPFSTYGDGQTINAQFINNVCNGGKAWISGTGTRISGGTMESYDYDGCISLRYAENVVITGVTFSGANGIKDYGLVSNGVTITYNDFTALSGTKISVGSCSGVTIQNNVGYP